MTRSVGSLPVVAAIALFVCVGSPVGFCVADAPPATAPAAAPREYRMAEARLFDALRDREGNTVELLGVPAATGNQQTCVDIENEGIRAFNSAVRAWRSGDVQGAKAQVSKADAAWYHGCSEVPGCASMTCAEHADFDDRGGPWIEHCPGCGKFWVEQEEARPIGR